MSAWIYDDLIGIIYHLRSALIMFEERAAKRHGREPLTIGAPDEVEKLATCKVCGHIGCGGTCR
jgi:hypothetical protein